MPSSVTSLFIILLLISYSISQSYQEVYGIGINQFGVIGTISSQGTPSFINLPNIVSCSGGAGHILCLSGDNEVWSFGNPWFFNYGQQGVGTQQPVITPVKILSNSSQVSCGYYFTAVLSKSGTVSVFGRGAEGQLGLGATGDHYSPQTIPGFSNIVAVTTGFEHTHILTNVSTVYSFGRNNHGQLGLGYTGGQVNIPTLIPNFSNISQIISGFNSYHSLFITNSGTLYSVGRNDQSQLCLSDTTARSSLTLLPGLPQIVQGATSDAHTVLLDASNNIYTCGLNDKGQLALGDNDNRNIPTMIPTIPGVVKQISCGFKNTYILTTLGTVYGSGFNQYVQLGTIASNVDLKVPTIVGSTFQYPASFVSPAGNAPDNQGPYWAVFVTKSQLFYHGDIPFQVVPYLTFMGGSNSKIHAGSYNSFVWSQSGQLSTFGLNSNGQLGLGTTLTQIFPVTHPFNSVKVVEVRGAKSWGQFTYFLDDQGRAWSMGKNSEGQLGLGDTNERTIPTLIPSLSSIIDVSSAYRSALILIQNGTSTSVFGTGENTAGGLGLGDTNIRTFPVRVPISGVAKISHGGQHSLFLTNTSQLFAVGNNEYGQLGQGTTNGAGCRCLTNIVQVGVVFNISAIAAGWQYSMFLTAYGRVYSMGRNNDGQLGFVSNANVLTATMVPLPLDIVQIAAGGQYFTLFLTNTTQVYAQGNSIAGQLGLGSTSSQYGSTLIPNFKNVIQIEVGTWHSLLLTKCPPKKAGSTCQFDTCFGISAATASVCSGQGTCVGIDTCSCFPPNTGSQCEIGEYHWIGPSTESWSNYYNWAIKRGDTLIAAVTAPGSFNENIYFDAGSSITAITLPTTLSITNLYVVGSNVTFVASSNNVLVGNSLILQGSSNVRFQGSVVAVAAASTFGLQNILVESGSTLTTINSLNMMVNKFTNVTGTLDAITITGTSDLFVFPGGHVLQSSKSSLSFQQVWNYGLMTSDNSLGKISFTCSVINNLNMFRITGSSSYALTGQYKSYSNANLYLVNSTLAALSNNFTIDGGFMYASGAIESDEFLFNSGDGFFSLLPPHRLKFSGNATFSSQSSMFLTINGTAKTDNDFLQANGTLAFNSLVLLRLGNKYTPQVNQLVPVYQATKFVSDTQQINLIGAPYKNAVYSSDGNLQIVFSLGNNNGGYKCHYLGNKKILEMNIFTAQNKIILSLTVPPRSSWIGFGFDLNGTLAQSMMTMTGSGSALEVLNHINVQPTLTRFLDVSSALSQSIFSIGPEYQTITLVFPWTNLKNQQNIYYAELNVDVNRTFTNMSYLGNHYQESYQFSVLNSPTVDCTNFLQPLRAEIYSIAGTVIMLIIYVILLVLCLGLSPFEPMNTRGISPALTTFLLMFTLLLEFKNLSEIGAFQGNLCFFYSFGIYPLQQIMFIMILFYFLRYFSVIALNESKEYVHTNFEENFESKKFQKFKLFILKLVNSTWFTIALLIVSYLAITFIFFIIISGWGYVCKFETLIVIRTIHTIELIIIYAVILITLLVDLLPNFRMLFLQCRWYEYIFKRDPYWFRVQILLFLPFMVYTLIQEFYTFFSSFNYVGIVGSFNPNIGMNTATGIILLCIVVILPIVITLWRLLRRIDCTPKAKIDENFDFDSVMMDTELKEKFRVYCDRTLALENFYCYFDIMTYKRTNTKAMELYFKYFNGTKSPLEIKIPRSDAKVIFERISGLQLDVHLFDEAEAVVRSNVYNSWSRFIVTSDYKNHVKGRKRAGAVLQEK